VVDDTPPEDSPDLPAPPQVTPIGSPDPAWAPAPSPMGSPQSPIAVSQGLDLGSLLVMIGGAMVVLAVFLPWVTASSGGVSASHNGIEAGTYGTLFLGAISIFRGAITLRDSSSTSARNRGNPLITAAFILGLLAIRWSTLQSYLTQERAIPGVTASLGIGVWLDIAGALTIAFGAWLTTSRRRASI
jgi:hypothetical protein